MKHTTLFAVASLWLVAPPGAMAQVSADSAHLQWQVPTLLPPGARLAVLTDALEEGGAAADLLAHLRGPGPHVRGCFVIDALLGIE